MDIQSLTLKRKYHEKKNKSAVISIVVIAVLLLSILIGVKNGTIDKLTKEMPTLATSRKRQRRLQ